MTKSQAKSPFILFSVFIGSAWGYSFLVRFSGFFAQTEKNKLLLLAFVIPLFCLLIFLLTRRIIQLGLQGDKNRIWIFQLCATVLVILLFVFIPEKTPPFPTIHTLAIEVTGKTNPQSQGIEVEITQITLPDGNPLMITDLQLTGAWNIGETNALGWQAGDRLEYQRELMGGINIVFRMGPKSGIAKITWDGKPQTVDLYYPREETKLIHLPGSSWGQPRPMWQALALAAVTADILSLITFCFLIIWWLERKGQLVQTTLFLWMMLVTFIFLVRWGPQEFWIVMARFELADALEPLRQWLDYVFNPYPRS